MIAMVSKLASSVAQLVFIVCWNLQNLMFGFVLHAILCESSHYQPTSVSVLPSLTGRKATL